MRILNAYILRIIDVYHRVDATKWMLESQEHSAGRYGEAMEARQLFLRV